MNRKESCGAAQAEEVLEDGSPANLDRRSFFRKAVALGLPLAAASCAGGGAGEDETLAGAAAADILIRRAYVITMDEERRVFTDGYLAVRDGTIVGVGQDSECTFQGKETIDGHGFVLMPGLINAHNHLVQIAARGRGDDPPPPRPEPGRDDMKARMRNLVAGQIEQGAHWDEERSYNLVRLHLLALLMGGTTGTHDQHFTNRNRQSIDGVLGAIHDSGMRALVARGTVNHPDMVPREAQEDPETGLQEVERLRSRWNSSRINVVPSPVGVAYIRSGEDIVTLKRGAEAMGAEFEMELAGNTGHMVMQQMGWRGGVIEYLDDLGVLDDTVLGDKGHLLQRQEYRLWKDRGMKVCMMPTLRISDGTGLPADQFMEVGILPGLGTDSMVTPSSLWRVMRYVLYAQRLRDLQQGVRRPGGRWGSSELVLEMATRGGAWALFMDGRTGSLEVGKEGDCILIDTNRPYLRPNVANRRLVSNLVWSGESDMVDTVMVAGKVLVRNGECRVWDEEEVIRTAETTLATLNRDSGAEQRIPARVPGRSIRNWNYL